MDKSLCFFSGSGPWTPHVGPHYGRSQLRLTVVSALQTWLLASGEKVFLIHQNMISACSWQVLSVIPQGYPIPLHDMLYLESSHISISLSVGGKGKNSIPSLDNQ